MQNPSTADEARRTAAKARRVEHLSWKHEFFHARSPPPPMGRLHRRQHDRKGGPPVAITLKRAREIVREEQRQQDAVGPSLGGKEGWDRRGDGGSVEPVTRQDVWVRDMADEERHRNPFLDVNIRSDARRTTIMANLPPQAVEEELRVFADQFGRVASVRIVRDGKTNKSRRYAFVEFGLPAEAAKAVQFSRKKRLRGRAITIDMERGRTQPGFLPKRLATAKALRGEPPHSEAATARRVDAVAAPQPDVDEDDALLASILGGSDGGGAV